MKKHDPLTQVELAVVIAIFALLLAVVMPSLTNARVHGKHAVCMANLRSLGICWKLYAEENDGFIANAKTARIIEVSSNPRRFQMYLSPGGYHNEPTWVGWFNEPRDSYGQFIADEIARKACITLGTLFPYNEEMKIYGCPAGDRNEYRTYSITDAMNGHDGFENANPPGKVIRKLGQIQSPDKRLVFIEEGFFSTESWTINPDRIQWWDRISLEHGEGTTVAMADGSVDYWKWKDQRTIDFATGLMDPILSAVDNPDFQKIQMAAWGHVLK